MDLLKTGKLFASLRREKNLTQKDVAQKLGICSKTVSKWETGRGFPDISIILELSKIFDVDISMLIKGEMPKIKQNPCNVKRIKFYVCPKCNNVLTSMSDSDVICCGRKLSPLKPNEHDDAHKLNIETIEDDFYITFSHPMTKEHYISFVSYVRFDRILTVKLYPEQGSEVRFNKMYGGKIYYYCTKHGLFEIKE